MMGQFNKTKKQFLQQSHDRTSQQIAKQFLQQQYNGTIQQRYDRTIQ